MARSVRQLEAPRLEVDAAKLIDEDNAERRRVPQLRRKLPCRRFANLKAGRATVFHQFDGGVDAPAWRPDSLRLALVACAQAKCGLYVANREGRDLRSIVNPEPNDVEAVAWSR